MIAIDSSVLIAAFIPSNEEHREKAFQALKRKPRLIAHSMIEAYSVLTRMPNAVDPKHVVEYLGQFKEPPLTLDSTEWAEFVPSIAATGISGGAAYDAVIATVAASHGATLISCDRRALKTYGLCGCQVELIQ